MHAVFLINILTLMFTKLCAAFLAVLIESRRDRHDIIAEILETAKGGATKTHIKYKAKLAYVQICEYIPLLVEKGFLENCTVKEHEQMKHLLKTTEPGEEFLENIKSVNLLWQNSTFEAPTK